MEIVSNEEPYGLTLESRTRLLAAGDDEAWRWFHECYYLSLLRYAMRRCGDADFADEIVQQTYLRVARHAKSFAVESDFWAWLSCIVRCVAIDHARAVTRRSTLMEKFAHWRAIHTEEETSWTAVHQHHSLANDALSRLPVEDAALLRHKYCDGNTTEELAMMLGMSPKAMEHRLARLREKLREIILSIQ